MTFGDKMKKRYHLLGFLTLTGVIVAIECIGIVMSMATFHPGGDVEVSDYLRRTAYIGDIISKPFMVPTVWFRELIGTTSFCAIVLYGALPLIYAATLYLSLWWILKASRTLRLTAFRTRGWFGIR